jgi:ABC-2 type transport system ATP-binding protein
MVGLSDTGNKTVRRFSLGMKQRLSIAVALLPDPELLVLDEPSNGLDPKGIIELRALIKHLNKTHGMTILISSHLLSEVEKMVSHVGIIYKGRLLFQGKLEALQALQQQGASLLIRTSDNAAACSLLEAYHPVNNGDVITIAYQHLSEVASINRMLAHHSIDVYLLQPKAQDLEQLFINLTTDPI